MFKKILAPLDFAEDMNEFAKCLTGFGRLGAEEMILAYCMDMPDISHLRSHVSEILGNEMEKLCGILRQTGMKVKSEVLAGPPAQSITEAVKRHECSLVVAGARVRSLLGESVLGSTAHAAMYHPASPVMIIYLHATEEAVKCCSWPCMPMESILFPTDFSDNALHAMTTLSALAQQTSAKVILMHVQDAAKWGRHLDARLEEFNRVDMERMNNLKCKLESQGVGDVEIEIEVGKPAKLILEAAERSEISCVLMGSQGRGFLGEITVGSVSHNVARHARKPVLLIPPEQKA